MAGILKQSAVDCQVGFGMTDPGVMWHPDGLTRFDPSPKKLIIDHTPYVIPRASYTIANLLSKAAGLCTGLCEVRCVTSRIGNGL